MNIEELKEQAYKGNAIAQSDLGLYYYYGDGDGIEQSYEKAVYWLRQSAKKGNAIAQYSYGMCYYKGEGVKQSYKNAVYWFKKAAKQKNAYAQSYLGNCYLHGIGTEQNFKEAERLLRESAKKGNEFDEYNTKIFDQLRGKKIQQIQNISEEFDEENVGAVLISPQENKCEATHTLYDLETYNIIKKIVNEILEDVEEVNPNKDNEFDVFMKVYTKLAKMILMDEQEAANQTLNYESRNLVGGLIKGKCVCAGFAEILRNALSCRGIDCIFISSDAHAFNQVKIGGKWYYCDLTFSAYCLKLGENMQYCLLSKEEFEDKSYRRAMQHQTVYPSPESYPQDKVNEAVKKIISPENNDFEKKAKDGEQSSLEEQIDEFSNNATFTGFQKVTSGFENDNNVAIETYKEVDSDLEQ